MASRHSTHSTETILRRSRCSIGKCPDCRGPRWSREFADRVRSLEEALANVKALQTLLPMCAYCKSIRNDQNYWEKVETYFTQHSNVSFTHSYCPNCYERFVRPELEALESARAAQDRQRRR